jgi:hypothetical protein
MFASMFVVCCPQAACTTNFRLHNLHEIHVRQNYFPEAILIIENVPKFLRLVLKLEAKQGDSCSFERKVLLDLNALVS